jgi:hypothetical protein
MDKQACYELGVKLAWLERFKMFKNLPFPLSAPVGEGLKDVGLGLRSRAAGLWRRMRGIKPPPGKITETAMQESELPPHILAALKRGRPGGV